MYDSAKFKERYRNDPAFRAMHLANAKRWTRNLSAEEKKVLQAKKKVSRLAWCEKESSKPKLRRYQHAYKVKNRSVIAVNRIIRRAKENGVEFDRDYLLTIAASHPDKCQCCGVGFVSDINTLKGPPPDRSFSVDKVDPNRGYLNGNVGIICWRCNSLKKNASLQELENIVAYVRKFLT